MQPKTLKILATVLIVFGCIFGLTQFKQRSTPKRHYLWEKAKDAQRLIITQGGKSVELAKTGDEWQLRAPFKFGADKPAVEEFLESLSVATLSEPLSTNPERHESFEVTPSSGIQLQAFLQADGKDPDLDIIIGKRGADYDAFFLRRPKEDEVREGRGLSRHKFEKKPGDWADKTVCKIESGWVKSIEIQQGKESILLTKKGELWHLGDAEAALSTSTVSSLVQPMLTKLGDLKADDIVPDVDASSTTLHALENPEMRLIVEYVHGDGGDQTLELAVGAKGSDYKHPARKKGVDKAVYQLSGWRLDPFRKKTPDFK